MSMASQSISGIVERVFVSVDERTGRSTVSFFPVEAAAPYQLDGDPRGDVAMAQARSIAARYQGCTVVGPHFHTSKEGGARPRRRRG
jgi:hypothetical protein